MQTKHGSYQEQSRKTYSDIETNDPIVYHTLGLVNEAGEVAGKIKKIFRDRGGQITDADREATLYPAGDLIKQVYTDPTFGGFGDFVSTFKDRIHTFLQQISDGASPDQIDGSGADGLAAQKVLAAAIESLDTESIVYVR